MSMSGRLADTKMAAPGGFSMALGGVAKKKVSVQIKAEEREKTFVSDLNATTLQELAQPAKKPVVIIPLLERNVWMPAHMSEDHGGGEKKTSKLEVSNEAKRKVTDSVFNDASSTDLDVIAARALLADSNPEQAEAIKKEIEVIPMLMRNAVPGLDRNESEEVKYKQDVKVRPESISASAANYDNVTIEDFGKGMLLGMGWKPGEAIGGTNKGLCEPIEFAMRGPRQGLGATAFDKRPAKKIIKPGETRASAIGPPPKGEKPTTTQMDAPLPLAKSSRVIQVHATRMREGALVEVLSGPKQGEFARVKDCSQHIQGRVFIRLNSSGKVMEIAPGAVNVLDENALPKDHPALIQEKKKEKKRAAEEASLFSSTDGVKVESAPAASSSSTADSPPSKKARTTDGPLLSWVVPHIRVRVINKKLYGGRYYEKKGSVAKVNMTDFVVKMDEDGKLLDDLAEVDLESALPKVGGRVTVLRGQRKGQTGKLLERDSAENKAVVELDDGQGSMKSSMDDIAETVVER